MKDRRWQCQNCQTIHQRDINAATNILNEGLRIQTLSGCGMQSDIKEKPEEAFSSTNQNCSGQQEKSMSRDTCKSNSSLQYIQMKTIKLIMGGDKGEKLWVHRNSLGLHFSWHRPSPFHPALVCNDGSVGFWYNDEPIKVVHRNGSETKYSKDKKHGDKN